MVPTLLQAPDEPRANQPGAARDKNTHGDFSGFMVPRARTGHPDIRRCRRQRLPVETHLAKTRLGQRWRGVSIITNCNLSNPRAPKSVGRLVHIGHPESRTRLRIHRNGAVVAAARARIAVLAR